MFASASLFASAAAFAVSLFFASRAFFAASDCFTASDMTLSDARSDSAFLAAASLALASAFLFIAASLCCFSEFCALSTAASLCFFKSAFALALYSASLLVSSALALMAASLFAASALACCALFSTSILASLSFCNCDALEACAKELSVRAFSAASLCASAALLCASACASFAFGVVVVVFATAAVFAGVVFDTTAVDFFAVDTTADFVSALYAFFAISICFLAFAFSNCAFFAAKSEAFSAEEAGTVIVPAPAVFGGCEDETTAVDFFAVDTTADFVSALYAFFAISICFLAFAFSNCAFFAAKSEAFSAEEAGTVIVPAPAETCAISEDVVVLICVLGIKERQKAVKRQFRDHG